MAFVSLGRSVDKGWGGVGWGGVGVGVGVGVGGGGGRGVGWGGVGWGVEGGAGWGGVGWVANFLFVFDVGVELLFCCRVCVVLLSVYFYN